jgi:hypothetical protein
MNPSERFFVTAALAVLAALYVFTVTQIRGCDADEQYTGRYKQCVMAKLPVCGKP